MVQVEKNGESIYHVKCFLKNSASIKLRLRLQSYCIQENSYVQLFCDSNGESSFVVFFGVLSFPGINMVFLFSGISTYFVGELWKWLLGVKWILYSYSNASEECYRQHLFTRGQKIPLINYQSKLISLTTGSVNTGHTFGLVTQMATERNWLVKTHCTYYQVLQQ